MNTKFITSLFICAVFIICSSLFYFNSETIIKAENRYVTQYPDFPQKLSSSKIKAFFDQLSMFYNDNFPCRNQIIEHTAGLIPDANTANPFGTTFRGKDEWIFLGNKADQTINKLTGAFYYHDTKIEKFSLSIRMNYYKNIAQNLSTASQKLLFVIAPNKTSIYPEYLPKNITPAEQPFHYQLTQKMQEEGMQIYYPKKDLLNAKKQRLLYYITDTHWNTYGAYIAFINMMQKYFPEYASALHEDDFTMKPIKSVAGDLINLGNFIFENKNLHDNFQAYYKNKPVTEPNGLEINTTQLFEHTNPNAPIDKSVWLIGDSFSSALLPYFLTTFQKVYYSSRKVFLKFSHPYPVQTDLIIYECVERAF